MIFFFFTDFFLNFFYFPGAHCFYISLSRVIAAVPLDLSVILGVNKIDKIFERKSYPVGVDEVIFHEDWRGKKTFPDADISILVLNRFIKFNEFVKPILILNGDKLSDGVTLGWESYYDESPTLKYSKMNLISIDECKNLQDDRKNLTNRTFCAVREIDAIIGDSGIKNNLKFILEF